jgi:hypothetical protein
MILMMIVSVLPPKIAGYDAEQAAAEESGDRAEQGDEQRISRAVDDPAEDVASELVRTEDVGRTRLLHHRQIVLHLIIIRCDQGREDCDQDQHCHDDQPYQCRRVSLEALPGLVTRCGHKRFLSSGVLFFDFLHRGSMHLGHSQFSSPMLPPLWPSSALKHRRR